MWKRVLIAIAAVVILVPPLAEAQLRTRTFVSGFVNPLAFVQDPTDRSVQFLVEQRGVIRVVRNGTIEQVNFLDLRGAITAGGEQGLLGLAFPPDAATSRRFYVNFTNISGDTVVARFRRSTNPLVADAASRRSARGGPGRYRIRRPPCRCREIHRAQTRYDHRGDWRRVER
jgi:hypothetical protein